MNAGVMVKKETYAGLFMVALATLMYEILLTRIFSVTMWYHFAFMAISVAMFGMTIGAILVYLLPNYFTQERAKRHLALSSLLFSISIVISFLTQLNIPFVPERSIVGLFSIAELRYIVLTYITVSVPFVFSGICVCLALTKFPQHVSKLYAADLGGAALGCTLLIYTLRIADGPTAMIVIALFASIGTIFFVADRNHNKLLWVAFVWSLVLASFSVVHTVQVYKQRPLLRLIWVKGHREPRPLYEKWNSFSRITVWGDPNKQRKPFGWGLSPTYPSNRKTRYLSILIDAGAGTILTAFDGDLNALEYLKYDVTNLAYYIRSNSKVLVIGTGGGRDILSALVFKQKSVLGVEINKDIINVVNQRFGDFTGHLDRNPKVRFVNEEARSYVARLKDRFDIIQASFIDTWAATTAGAFVLTENSLYTVEAWKVFLKHLTPNGVLTFSRWYFRDRPGEVYRLTSLASTSLMQLGVKSPRDHIIIVKRMREKTQNDPNGVGTILVSKEPFSDKDLDVIERVARKMQFDIVLTPRFSVDSTFATIASGKELDIFTAKFPINIAAPTDDSPFFFHMLRLRNMFNRELWNQGVETFNMKAVFILGVLFIIVLGLTFLCIIAPLILTTKKVILKGALPLFIFFMAIGFGFMLIEISQMQRLIIFLGHPIYGLSITLFTLLLSSGLGSYSTWKINNPGMMGSAIMRLLLLLCILTIFGMFTPYVLSIHRASTTMLRIFVAIGILFPLGLFMGMAFPLGMKIASIRSPLITPWLWGINGATSVCASVLAAVIALSSSISATFWSGFSCYLIAFIVFIWASLRKS